MARLHCCLTRIIMNSAGGAAELQLRQDPLLEDPKKHDSARRELERIKKGERVGVYLITTGPNDRYYRFTVDLLAVRRLDQAKLRHQKTPTYVS
jgi:hypothetical protein